MTRKIVAEYELFNIEMYIYFEVNARMSIKRVHTEYIIQTDKSENLYRPVLLYSNIYSSERGETW